MVNFTLPNSVHLLGALVTEWPGELQIGAILGMDVICMGDLSITHVGGKTCMSFRTPSCATIDYVSEYNRIVFAGVGRNEPCPCGKEKAPGVPVKFKHCHGA